jgi:hypothetical protein
MNIEIYVCDNAGALVQTLGSLDGRATILYKSPDATGETGDVLRYLVVPPRSAAKVLESFAGKLLVIARRN